MKIYNTADYRADKRVVSFIDKEVKRVIIKNAKKNKLSVSKEIAQVLTNHYFRKV